MPADYIQWERVSYSTTQQFVLLLNMCLQMYTVKVHKGYDKRCNSSRSTNGQISAYQNSVWHKRVLNVMLFSTNFSSLYRDTSTDFGDVFTDHVTWCILSVWEFIALSWNRGGDWWVWEALYQTELCPFANYSCVMEKGVFVLYFIFHQFRTNLLDMPHRIWRKTPQIM